MKAVEMTCTQALAYYKENDPRGEYVLVIQGVDPQALLQEAQDAWKQMSVTEHVNMYMDQGMSKKDAMKAAAADRGAGKREIYQALLEEAEADGGEGRYG